MIADLSLSPFARWGVATCAAIAVLALLINPIGYVGGHNDDWRYLEAARCWVAHGEACLPATHWATRWPLLAPIATVSAALGESRFSIGLAMLPWWIGAIVLLGWLGRLWIDRGSGLIAATLLAATPVFTQSALQPNVDIVELALQLAALVGATISYRSGSRAIAVAAGLCAALAVQTRETSLLFCAMAALAWLVLPRPARGVLVWSVAGFALAMAAELLVYWVASGDPLFRYRLAFNHGAIASDELPAGFALNQSPLLNPAFIASWRREMGINWWWPIDPWLNLIASPRIGVMLVGASLLGASQWRLIERPVRRRLRSAVLVALLIALMLVYGLAVDPKPRMFLMLAAVAALVGGAGVAAAVRAGRGLVPLVALALLLGHGLFTLSRINSTREYEALASRWIGAHRGQISLDANAASTLALVPGSASLPAGSRDFRIAGGNEPCRVYAGTTVDRSEIIGGGQLCLQDMRRLRRAR